MHRSRLTGTARTVAGTVAAALLALAGTASGSTAAEPADEAELLTVTAGFGDDGLAVPGTWTPVEVTIEPPRLLAGELTLVSDSVAGRMLERRRVEVPAGSRQVFRFLAAPTRSLEVHLEPDGGETLRRRVRLTGPAGAFLVGALGGVPAGLPPLAALATGQRGLPVPVDPAWVERSPAALEALGTLLAPMTELRTLTATGRRNLAVAVAAGLDLAVVADAAGPLDLDTLLPWSPVEAAQPAQVTLDGGATATVLALSTTGGAWGMTADQLAGVEGAAVVAAATAAGRGRVAVTGVAPGRDPLGGNARLWAHLLQPGPLAGGSFGDGPARRVHAATEVLGSGGLALPGLPWLTTFLLAYVVLVGPVNGVVLSRIGRRELAWVTVPVITVLFAAGGFLAAARSQPPVGLSGQVTWWVGGAGTEILATAVRAPTPGDHSIALPGEGWEVLTGRTRRPATVDREAARTTVRMDLAALEVGTVLGRRATDAPPPLEVSATATSEGVEVAMTNTSAAEIRDITVRAATATRRVGRLEAGERRTVTVASGGVLPAVAPGDEGLAELRHVHGRLETPAGLLSLLRSGPVTGDPGLVWVTGTAEVAGMVARVDGREAQNLGALFAVAAPPAVDGATLSPFAVQRTLLDSGHAQELHRVGPLAVEGGGQAVLRYRLPATGRVAALVSTLDRGVAGPARPPAPPPPFGAVPECPPDAVRCVVTEDGWEFCFPDGSCEGGSVDMVGPVPTPAPGALRLEVYDHAEVGWVPAAAAFGAGGGDPERLLSPLGEVHVRAAGDLIPFDFSARGIGARLEGDGE